jgi:hypothetical protein
MRCIISIPAAMAWVIAECPQLQQAGLTSVAAFCMVGLPDLLPNVTQRDLMLWWRRDVPEPLRAALWAIPPDALSQNWTAPSCRLPIARSGLSRRLRVRRRILRRSIPAIRRFPPDQDIQSVLPDAQGRLWFTTSGTTDPTTGNATSPAWVSTLVFTSSTECTVKTLQLEPSMTGATTDESISKSFAVEPVAAQGGVFIVSDYAMYRFDAAADGTPQITWREEYDRGNPPPKPKPGQIQTGSGTTPTLMGTDFVTITDNAYPQMDVLVYQRAAQVQGSRLVCKVPVFEKDKSDTENSLIATNQSIIVENNFGYYGPQATVFNRATTPGITRIDLNADQTGCNTVWTNNQESIPSVVSQMSLANGLIYTYTKDPDSCSIPGPCYTAAWYLTAIDFASGETVFKPRGGTGIFTTTTIRQCTSARTRRPHMSASSAASSRSATATDRRSSLSGCALHPNGATDQDRLGRAERRRSDRPTGGNRLRLGERGMVPA